MWLIGVASRVVDEASRELYDDARGGDWTRSCFVKYPWCSYVAAMTVGKTGPWCHSIHSIGWSGHQRDQTVQATMEPYTLTIRVVLSKNASDARSCAH